MTIPRFSLPHSAKAATCTYCRQPLDPLADDQTEVCARPTCQTRHKVNAAAAIARKSQTAWSDFLKGAQRRTRKAVKQAARDLGHPDLRKVVHGLAPHIDQPVIPLPTARRAAFEDHLRSIITQSFEADDGSGPGTPEDDPGYARRQEMDKPEPMAVNAACIACQGDCCLLGAKKHAFLTEKTIDYVRWSNPDLSEDALFALYQSHYPAKSTQDSCVYHGDKGCTLQRHLRADICNSFQCSFRQKLYDKHRRRPDAPVVIAGISRDHADDRSAGAPYLRVVSVTNGDTVRVHSNVQLTAMRKPKS